MIPTTSPVPRLLTAPRRRGLVDAAIAAAATAVSAIMLTHGSITPTQHPPSGLDAGAVILVLCTTLPLIAWRRFPLGVYLLTGTASAALIWSGYWLDLPVGPLVALYLLTAGADRPPRGHLRTAVSVAGVLAGYVGAVAVAQPQSLGPGLLHTGLATASAWFAGERTRLRREQLAELRERATRVERDAERDRQLAVAQERTRIARDLHDSAGHAISVIAVRAGAARLRHHHEPDRSLAALAAIEDLARQTAEEIDQIVATLREATTNAGEITTPHGLASLDTLIQHHAVTGVTVTLARSGELRPLHAIADQAAYRILQEALTNAARHGTGEVRLSLHFGTEALDITVSNKVRTAADLRSGGGHGLVGMRERATMVGGSLEGVRANGTFRLSARIPYGGPRA